MLLAWFDACCLLGLLHVACLANVKGPTAVGCITDNDKKGAFVADLTKDGKPAVIRLET